LTFFFSDDAYGNAQRTVLPALKLGKTGLKVGSLPLEPNLVPGNNFFVMPKRPSRFFVAQIHDVMVWNWDFHLANQRNDLLR
jgi:hypothetical protein